MISSFRRSCFRACGLLFTPLRRVRPTLSIFMVFADLLPKRDCLYHDIYEPCLPHTSRQRQRIEKHMLSLMHIL
jgi:hypothetical protein